MTPLHRCSLCQEHKPLPEMTQRHGKPGTWCKVCHNAKGTEARERERRERGVRCRGCKEYRPLDAYAVHEQGRRDKYCDPCRASMRPGVPVPMRADALPLAVVAFASAGPAFARGHLSPLVAIPLPVAA